MKNQYDVVYEKAGVFHYVHRMIFADSLQEAQELACRLFDDHLRRVQCVELSGVIEK